MRTKGLIRSLGLPPQHYLSVAFLDLKTVEDRQDPADVLADPLKSLDVFLFQPVQHGRQIAAVTAKLVVFLRVPTSFEVRRVGCVVKLVDRAIAEKVNNDPGSGCVDIVRFAGLRGPDNLGFLVPASKVLPRRYRRQIVAVESESLLAEKEAVGMCVGKHETIIVTAPIGTQCEPRPLVVEYAGCRHTTGSSAPPCILTNSASLRDLSIQLSISKNRMKFDLPEPLAPIRTAALGIPTSSTSANDRKPLMRTESIRFGIYLSCQATADGWVQHSCSLVSCRRFHEDS